MNNPDRGLLAGYNIQDLQRKISDPVFAPIWDRIVRGWREAAAKEEAAGGKITYTFTCGCSSVAPQLRASAVIQRLTGDPQALEYVRRQIDKMALIWTNPPESVKHHCGGRPTTYFSSEDLCLAADACRATLDRDRYQTVLRLARDHFIDDHQGVIPFHNYSSGHNIPLTQTLAAGGCALTLGAESGHPAWQAVVDLAVEACKLYARWGLDEAGMPYEATMYGLIVIARIMHFAEQLRLNGGENLFDTMPILRRASDMLVAITFPDRTGVISTGDSHGLVSFANQPWLLLTARHFDRPQDLALWHELHFNPDAVRQPGDLSTLLWWDGQTPTPLSDFNLPTAWCAQGTATVTCRTGWGRDATFLNVLGQGRSHASHGHPHADVGHFTIMTGGEQLAIDKGYWNYNEDLHTTVMVDGQGLFDNPEGWYGLQPYAGRLAAFQRHALLDYILVDGKAAKHCIWADRHVLFVRLGNNDAYVVMIDNINRDNAKHRYLWQLQAHPAARVELTGDTSAIVQREKSRLECTFINPAVEDFPSDPHTLVLRTDEKQGAEPENSRSRNPRLLAEQTGLNCQIMAVLAPRRAAAPQLKVRDATVRRTFRVEIDAGDFRDTIIAGLDHAYLRFPDVSGMTELALIRRDRSGKLIDSWTVDGVPLVL